MPSQSSLVFVSAAAAVACGGLYLLVSSCQASKKAATKGPLTDRQVHLLRTTWAQVSGDLDAVAAIFYRNLFEANPSFPKTLFKNVNMAAQGKRLMAMVGGGVMLIDQPDKLVPILHASGVRHVAYGVTDDQYAAVGAAFMKTLAAGLGASFTPEVSDAWLQYYTIAQSVMIKAQNSAEGQAQLPNAATRRANWMVQDSWEKITDAADFTKTFYANLFSANPELTQAQFKGVNMTEQGQKLATMIGSGVTLLNRLGELVPVLKASGARHVRYGTKPEHYPLVGAALLKTLRTKLGEKAWTPELEREWTRVYQLMADTMIAGAKEAEAAQAKP